MHTNTLKRRRGGFSAVTAIAVFAGTATGTMLTPSVVQAAEINGAVTGVNIVATTIKTNTQTKVTMNWVVPNGTQAGDTFQVVLPADPFSGITSPNFTLTDTDGSVVANAVVVGRTVTFTMTAYAANHINVRGTAEFMAKVANNATLGAQTPVIQTTGKTFTDNVTVVAGAGQGDNTKVGSVEKDATTGLPFFAWKIKTGEVTSAQTVTVTDTPVAPLTLDCATITVRVAGTLRPAAIDSCTPTKLVVSTNMTVGQSMLIQGQSVFPAGAAEGDPFTNRAVIDIDGGAKNTQYTVKYPAAGGSGTGDQFVSVGDYVWLDANHDGIQQSTEQGIPDVGLTISRTDGAPVTDYLGNPYVPDAATDADGLYTFTNLPVPPAGVNYTVTIDPDTVPAGYFPTLTGQGTTATDSSTGSATSSGLTTLGDRDPTLDFGFWNPTPQVDIEKGDAAGNDADTSDLAVDLGMSPGSTDLAFTVTNPGNEPLTTVAVKDVVVSNGTVTGLVCTFPDGSTGTTWAGPWQPAASFDCTAKLAGVVSGAVPHRDSATVTAVGQTSKKPVTDTDDYWAKTSKTPSVCVGDYVWFDTNHNGVQDVGETGVPGVKLAITRTDGKPATNSDGTAAAGQTTGADGSYHFCGLSVLPAGVQYTVTVDPSTYPTGYFPTLTGQGTTSTDSSTGSATSTDLTTDGAKDDTLDFGLWKPTPKVDIEKVDAKGNDADTSAEAVNLGVSPGSTDLTFIVKNPGTEALTGVDVSDVVKSNGTIAGLSCTFPNASVGLTWAGPFAPGASFECHATLSGVVSGAVLHQDTASVKAVGELSKTPVTDNDDYWAKTVEPAKVSVGDYVWFDADHDGIQETGEKGIPGVKLAITRTDGKPALLASGATPGVVTTDANGGYTYAGLAALPAGVQYKVAIDMDTVPAGFYPTITGQGTTATDSSTGFATSTDLTKDGDADPTLDFGFWKPAPVIDIVKKDIKGFDANTAAEAADLGMAPGGRALVFTIANKGNEPIKNPTVSDVVISNGTVEDLSCTFPDGAEGLTWTGTLSVGGWFKCTAMLVGVGGGAVLHQDRATVTGTGAISGTPVKDQDDYWAKTKEYKVVQVQLDRYRWGNAIPGKAPSLKYGNKIAAMDDDARLAYGEDFWVGKGLAKPYTDKKTAVVRVTVPVDASNQDIIDAVNKVIVGGFNTLATTAKLGTVKGSGAVTDAFIMPAGATSVDPWGPTKAAQVFLGRSLVAGK
ncbi:MAG: Ig-like domain-containing protein [Tetrasphaera jenkinsii]|nr:Ig-like domain-containing protein [Tetrasphaera jenkinsii]